MNNVKKMVDLTSTGIKNLTIKKGRTGVTILELDGDRGEDKADKLTRKY